MLTGRVRHGRFALGHGANQYAGGVRGGWWVDLVEAVPGRQCEVKTARELVGLKTARDVGNSQCLGIRQRAAEEDLQAEMLQDLHCDACQALSSRGSAGLSRNGACGASAPAPLSCSSAESSSLGLFGAPNLCQVRCNPCLGLVGFGVPIRAVAPSSGTLPSRARAVSLLPKPVEARPRNPVWQLSGLHPAAAPKCAAKFCSEMCSEY